MYALYSSNVLRNELILCIVLRYFEVNGTRGFRRSYKSRKIFLSVSNLYKNLETRKNLSNVSFYLIRKHRHSNSGTYFSKITTNQNLNFAPGNCDQILSVVQFFSKQTIIMYVGYVGKVHDKLGLIL